MLHEFAAIDPMALMFPSRLYLELSEKLHTQAPKSNEIRQALGRLTPQERKYILVRARMLSTCSKAVEDAMAGMDGAPERASKHAARKGWVGLR